MTSENPVENAAPESATPESPSSGANASAPQGAGKKDFLGIPPAKRTIAIATVVVVLILIGLVAFALWPREPGKPEILYLKAEATFPSGDNLIAFRFTLDEARCKEMYKERWEECEDRRDQIRAPEAFPAISPDVPGEWRYTDSPSLRYKYKGDYPANTKFTFTLPEKLLGEKVVIEPLTFTFTSEPLKVRSSSVSMEYDRSDPRKSYVNAGVVFNWWVDREKAQSLIVLEGERGSELRLEDIEYYWQNDWTVKVSARVKELPGKDTYVFLRVKPGITTKDGSDTLKAQVESRASVPSKENILKVQNVSVDIVNKDLLREQTLFVGFNLQLDPARPGGEVRALLLPKYKDPQKKNGSYYSWTIEELDKDARARSTPITMKTAPLGEGLSDTLAWSFKAEPGRQMLVQIPKGMAAPGGFNLSVASERILDVPAFERELYIMQSGNVLSLGGEKKLSVFARGFDKMLWEIQRVRPEYINHLVTQNHGSFASPRFKDSDGYYEEEYYDDEEYSEDDDYYDGGSSVSTFDYYDISEVFNGSVALEPGDGSEPRFTSIDLGGLVGWGKPGIFHIKLRGENKGTGQDMSDKFVLVTDLGVMMKEAKTGERDVFVVSLSKGEPVSGARVDVLGRNGVAVLTLRTDYAGHVLVPALEGLRNEKEPVALTVSTGPDLTFVPLKGRVGKMDLSKFSVGGREYRGEDIASFVFSERGIYRPGETLRFGVATKRADWAADKLQDMPLHFEITDPAANSVFEEDRNVEGEGLDSVELPLPEDAQAGVYRLSVSIASGEREGTVLGSASVRVEEFKPDTLKIRARLSEMPVKGWLKPEEAKGLVDLENLYGTPAAEHRVSAQILVRPPDYSFSEYSAYTFRDPAAEIPDSIRYQVYELGSQDTDEQGRAEFDLNLDRFSGTGFGVTLEAEGFEAGGGRSVTGIAYARVSPRDWLVGWKTDSVSSWLRKDVLSKINFIAVDQKLERVEAGQITFAVNAIDYVATLVRTSNGYKYDQIRKTREVKKEILNLAAKGLDYTLPTSAPGEYELVLTDASGERICVYPFVVAGAGVAAFGRERDATMRMYLNKRDFQGGEEIEVYLSAPYSGAGLITLEGAGVVAYKWFNTELTDSIQRIRVPEEFEGRGFVSVSLVRGLQSKEIYMSPHTYALEPFYANIQRRDLGVALTTPDKVKPGEDLTIGVSSKRPGRAIVFAVDEGILQLTSYKTPNPLSYFMREQGLNVRSSQTFELLMPEYSLVREAMAAFGGDYAADMAKEQSMLNPFRRQAEKSVVYWSGLVEIGPASRELSFTIPSYFNGRLRVMAVAMGKDGVSAFSKNATVRGDVIVSADMPVAAAPGDEFDVTIAIANNIEGSGKGHAITLALDPGKRLEIVGEAPKELNIDEGREGRAVVRLKALDSLGEGVLGITAASKTGSESATRPATISVRPATPRMSAFDAGRIKDSDFTYTITRNLYEEYGSLQGSASALPVPVMDALSGYLLNFPYGCTEQILSAAFPYVILHKNPEFLPLPRGKTREEARKDADAAVNRAVYTLLGRQVRSGQFSLWPEGGSTYDFLTVYAADFLSSAREAGFNVPAGLEKNTMNRLRDYVNHEPSSLAEARQMAYAAWVLTRNGNLTANSIAGLTRWLETKYTANWKTDLAAVYIAACNIMMKRQKEADALIGSFTAEKEGFWQNSWFDSPLGVNAQYLTIIARHFPERLEDKATQNVLALVIEAVMKNHYSSISASQAVRALSSYAEHAVADREDFEIVALGPDGKPLEARVIGSTVKRIDLMGASSLSIRNAKNLYWQVSSNGFDRVPPEKAMFSGLEFKLEYLDAKTGKPVEAVRQGDEVLVVLRALCNRGNVSNVALVAPLPGGFEQVISRAGRVQSEEERGYDDEDDDGYEDGDSDGDSSALPDGQSATDRDAQSAIEAMIKELGIKARPMAVTSTDRREDRMIVYTSLGKEETVFIYRIKAINKGTFTLPPVYAEALYERTLRANTAAGKLKVE